MSEAVFCKCVVNSSIENIVKSDVIIMYMYMCIPTYPLHNYTYLPLYTYCIPIDPMSIPMYNLLSTYLPTPILIPTYTLNLHLYQSTPIQCTYQYQEESYIQASLWLLCSFLPVNDSLGGFP